MRKCEIVWARSGWVSTIAPILGAACVQVNESDRLAMDNQAFNQRNCRSKRIVTPFQTPRSRRKFLFVRLRGYVFRAIFLFTRLLAARAEAGGCSRIYPEEYYPALTLTCLRARPNMRCQAVLQLWSARRSGLYIVTRQKGILLAHTDRSGYL